MYWSSVLLMGTGLEGGEGRELDEGVIVNAAKCLEGGRIGGH